MAEQPRPDDLAQLRARLDIQEAEIGRLKRRRRIPRRLLPLALAALLVTLLPLSILAAGPVFSDLGTAAPVHQPNIQAIGDAGITTGFEDSAHPGQRLYNPKDNVTREEMASFLARTAGLGANPPVVNAKTAQTTDSATNAITAQNLQGYTPNALVRVFGAANSTNITGGEIVVPGGSPGTTIITTTFTAPAPGYVLLIASLAFFPPATGCPCNVGYYSRIGAGPLSSAVASPVMADTLANGDSTTGAVTWTFPVAAGANTFSVVAYRVGASTVPVQARTAVTGIYTPFGANGTTP